MICLAYMSSANTLMTADELASIVEVSQRNNSQRHVTGLLCHNDGSFMQFLEGPEAEVEMLYAKISMDPRHRQILRVYQTPIETRAFGDWSMAVVRAGEVSPTQQAFCQNLRKVEISASASHRAALDGFLTTFRAWLR